MFPSLGRPHKAPRRRTPTSAAEPAERPAPATSSSTTIACFAQYLSVDDRLVSRLDNAAKAPDRPQVSAQSEASVIVSQAHRLCLQTARFGLPAGIDAVFETGTLRLQDALGRYRANWETRRCVVPMNAFMAVTATTSLWWSMEDAIVYAAALRHTVNQNGQGATHFQLIRSPLPDRRHAPAFLPGAMIGWWLRLAGSDAADYLQAAPQPELEHPRSTWSPTLDHEDMRGMPWLAAGGGIAKPHH